MKPDEAVELKPCPFCGSPAKETYDQDCNEWWIVCSHGSCDVEPSIAGNDLAYIRKSWNRRQDSAALRAQLNAAPQPSTANSFTAPSTEGVGQGEVASADPRLLKELE